MTQRSSELVAEVDWFVGLDARLPTALLRYLAQVSTHELSNTVTAVLRIAQRCWDPSPPAADAVRQANGSARPGTGTARVGWSRIVARRPGDVATAVRTDTLPADIGTRLLDELEALLHSDDASSSDLGRRTALRPLPSTQAAARPVADVVAPALGIEAAVAAAGVAVAMTAIGSLGVQTWCVRHGALRHAAGRARPAPGATPQPAATG